LQFASLIGDTARIAAIDAPRFNKVTTSDATPA
jgi:hypothetical protein